MKIWDFCFLGDYLLVMSHFYLKIREMALSVKLNWYAALSWIIKLRSLVLTKWAYIHWTKAATFRHLCNYIWSHCCFYVFVLNFFIVKQWRHLFYTNWTNVLLFLYRWPHFAGRCDPSLWRFIHVSILVFDALILSFKT